MTTPDFEIPKGNVKPGIRQHLWLAGAVNLTGATLKFRFRPEGAATPITERTGTIIGTPTGGLAAATELDAELTTWETADVGTIGRYEFQWKFTLADASVVHVPVKSPRNGDQERVWQVFEVVEVI